MIQFEETDVEVELSINSKDMKHIGFTIESQLKGKFEKKAFANIGIIDKILSIQSIYNESISNLGSCDIQCNARLRLLRYLPKRGDSIDIKIQKVLPYGIYMQEGETMKILLKKKKDHEYMEGGFVNVHLTDVRFEKDGFMCLAESI